MSADLVTLSATSDVEWSVRNVRRTQTNEPYPSGTVTVTVQLFDPTATTSIGSVIPATWDSVANAFVAIVGPVSNVYALAMVRETVVANGRTRISWVPATIAA